MPKILTFVGYPGLIELISYTGFFFSSKFLGFVRVPPSESGKESN